ncbi:hypothetical protein AJ85_02245 [Alkalihalobacillus alcalophilus ATCC 27647 = CGMCC 1.3604]|uniref:Uncharacterized protein n=1 Tax=Alkalihalobacillus alcalophilus ATCC 27647 = CGMCC 1.3604 TaxID=1218173 RepID=A0A4S4JWI0_ALKAL|nr:hypothetical protein AJ85_02245 [Alkalihalobacillus alcalophilus ATCC 27647 = CGMCC 1.3604]
MEEGNIFKGLFWGLVLSLPLWGLISIVVMYFIK